MRFEETTTALEVRPNDLDSLGHVNNAVVLEYLEAGRWAWMAAHGLKRASAVVPVVSRIEVDYRREILPQAVQVRTSLERDDAPSDDGEDLQYRVHFRQQLLIDGGAKVAAEARVQVAFIDAAERSLCTLQDFLSVAKTPGR